MCSMGKNTMGKDTALPTLKGSITACSPTWPSCPYAFSPHAYRAPRVLTASVCVSPALTWAIGGSPPTRKGRAANPSINSSSGGERSIGVKSGATPHWPWVLSPHAMRAPSASTAAEWRRPALTDTAGLDHGKLSCFGVHSVIGVLLGAEEIPSCP